MTAAALPDMNPGATLPNGAVVIARSAAKANWIILALRPGYHLSDSYATWVCNRDGDGNDTRWGHYHDNIRDAVNDYYDRIVT